MKPAEEVVDVEETLRQPIVAVTGHVDHGKTSLLDLAPLDWRQDKTNVMNREAGGITQELGVTNVPAELLVTTPFKPCRSKKSREFESPGIIFHRYARARIVWLNTQTGAAA